MLVKSLQKILVDRSFSRREEFEERLRKLFFLPEGVESLT
jgi:hypothetical protein